MNFAELTQPEAAAPGLENAGPAPARIARVAIFTHDTFGLGHVRRCLRIMRALAAAEPSAALLLMSGSPALRLLPELPPHADILKIPTIAKTGSRLHQPPHLPIAQAGVALMRERLILEATTGYGPDLFLADNFPLGSQNELLPALQELRRRPARTVLGLRDIVDAPDVVRRDWGRQGLYHVLDRYYDRVLVYGDRAVFDVAEAYGLPGALAAKLTYCGYVTDAVRPATMADARTALGVRGPFLLAAGGGGGDAFPLLRTFIGALAHVRDREAVVVTGPLMSAADRRRLADLVADSERIRVVEFVPDLARYFSCADLLVSMCGYNTAAEIVETGARALVVPRTWAYGEHRAISTAAPEWEQPLRARALAARGLVHVLEPSELTPPRLAEAIQSALAHPRPARDPSLDLQGLAAVVRELRRLLS